MTDIYRRKAFARAGYEDPTNVLRAEAEAMAKRPKNLFGRLFGILPWIRRSCARKR
jgi:hypothetical protein